MTPALAHGSLADCVATRALKEPSAANDSDMRRKESDVVQMSLPPPWTVQVPALSDCAPAGVAPPMSWQVQPLGHAPCGGIDPRVTATWSMGQVADVPWFHGPVAIPASSEPFSEATA